ncbi:predicted protein, partial [Nematostella vectensis]
VRVVTSSAHQAEEVPELHPTWMHNVQYVEYVPIPVQYPAGSLTPVITDEASVEEWRERASFIDEDLKWLLCLPHNEFWCQVIFDDTLKNCLDSYLQHAPRWFDASSVVPREVELLQKGIHHRVFMVYLRMSTHKESQSNFLTPEVFGDILYNHFLFDIPKLMDLCALYGGESNQNMPLLRKMIVNIFSKQPNALLEVYNKVLEQRDQFSLDNDAMRRSATPSYSVTLPADFFLFLKFTYPCRVSEQRHCKYSTSPQAADELHGHVEDYLQILTSVLTER